MTMQELKEILAEQFSCDESELSPATTLSELGADQEDMIELAWQLGEAIGVEVDEDRLADAGVTAAAVGRVCPPGDKKIVVRP